MHLSQCQENETHRKTFALKMSCKCLAIYIVRNDPAAGHNIDFPMTCQAVRSLGTDPSAVVT